jgi:hypothetical protein
MPLVHAGVKLPGFPLLEYHTVTEATGLFGRWFGTLWMFSSVYGRITHVTPNQSTSQARRPNLSCKTLAKCLLLLALPRVLVYKNINELHMQRENRIIKPYSATCVKLLWKHTVDFTTTCNNKNKTNCLRTYLFITNLLVNIKNKLFT